MRKLLFFVVLCAAPLHATTWYATSGFVNFNAANLWVPTHTGNCTGSGTPLVWGSQAAGDVFEANHCNNIAINVDPGANGQVTLKADFDGAYTYTTSANLTIHADIVAPASNAISNGLVTITGGSGGGTFSGNVTGGGSTNIHAVEDDHVTVTVTLTGNATGGSASNSFGWSTGAAGPVVINGNVAAGTGQQSYGLNMGATGSVATVNGTISGSDTAVAGFGVWMQSTGTLTATGNLVNGKSAFAVGGYEGTSSLFFYIPASNSNYILIPKDSSYTLGTVNSHATQMFPASAIGSGGTVQTTVQN